MLDDIAFRHSVRGDDDDEDDCDYDEDDGDHNDKKTMTRIKNMTRAKILV